MFWALCWGTELSLLIDAEWFPEVRNALNRAYLEVQKFQEEEDEGCGEVGLEAGAGGLGEE